MLKKSALQPWSM